MRRNKKCKLKGKKMGMANKLTKSRYQKKGCEQKKNEKK